MTILRPIGIDNDSETYEMSFINFEKIGDIGVMEPSYIFISALLNKFTSNVHWLFFIYCTIGLCAKFKAIRELTPQIFLAIALYIGNIYILHEYTQIRAGVASGFLLLAIKPLGDGKKVIAAIYISIALLFHYSSIVMFPLLFLSSKKISKKWKIALWLIVPTGYLVHFLNLGIGTIPIPYISEKLSAYQELKNQGFIDEVNVFNLVFIIKIAIFYYLLYFYNTIQFESKYVSIMLKIMALSLFSFPAFSSLPVLSFRISELFGTVEFVLFTYIFYTVKPYWTGKAIVCLIALSLFSINAFYNGILHFDI